MPSQKKRARGKAGQRPELLASEGDYVVRLLKVKVVPGMYKTYF